MFFYHYTVNKKYRKKTVLSKLWLIKRY